MRLVSKIILILVFLPSLSWAFYNESHFVAVTDTINDGGKDWQNLDSAFADDGQYMNMGAKMKNGQYADVVDFKMGSNHFNIPSGATDIGVLVEIEARDVQTGPAGDSLIKLLIAGSPSGSDYKVETDSWPTSLDTNSWGGEDSTWGLTLTPAQVNDTAFGVRIHIVEQDGSFAQIEIDFVKITVYYTEPTATAVEVLKPESIVTDNWDSTGSGTKVQMLLDQTDANYIWTANVTNDRYELTDATFDTSDVSSIDSVKIYWRGKDAGGSNNVQMGIVIGSDISNGTNQALGLSWTDYTETFTSPPGSRGSWDRIELDSLRVNIAASLVNDTCKVTACSLLVFTTLVVPGEIYAFSTTDTNCAAGSNFGHLMDIQLPHPLDTIEVLVPGGKTDNDIFVTGDSIPYDADWPTGGFIVRLNIIKQVNPGSLQVRIERINTSCAIQENTPWYPSSNLLAIDSTGEYVLNIPSHDWSAGSLGDRLRVKLQWQNGLFQNQDTVWIETGVGESIFETSINDNRSTEKAGSGCSTVEVLDPDGIWSSQNAWSTSDPAGKVDAVSDNIDGDYITAKSGSVLQSFTLEESAIGTGTVDSVFVVCMARKTGGAKKLKFRAYTDSSAAKFCESSPYNMPHTWDTLTWKLPGFPSGLFSCTNSFTVDSLNKLMITLSGDRKAGSQVTELWLEVCYTAAGGAVETSRRRRILLIGAEDKKLKEVQYRSWAGLAGYNPDPIVAVNHKWFWSK